MQNCASNILVARKVVLVASIVVLVASIVVLVASIVVLIASMVVLVASIVAFVASIVNTDVQAITCYRPPLFSIVMALRLIISCLDV